MPIKELPKSYNPSEYEDEIYAKWEKSGFFNPDNLEGRPYSIMMPPPNVTGVLHLGHALENSLMDIMARYQRMNGKKVLLVPGTDHAAVATQAKVEKILVGEGVKNPRLELGREKLLEKIREFAENSKATILGQIKKMGTSCDWSRLAYTFDEPRNKAVNEVFVRMYNDGLIYRGHRVVNWSVKGQSTSSDDELIYIERPAKLWTFKYGPDFPIAIASSRPETKLGDTAVAVNPKDKRYKKYIGQTFTVDVGAAKPLKLKIIADPAVDMEFGTGAIGVTPAHSMVDFEMYEKQKALNNPIELIQVIGQDGKMTAAAGSAYAGLTTEQAREKFVAWLKENNLLIKEEDIVQNVGTSDRFGDIVEAIPMTQWFVDVNKKIPGRGASLKELIKQAIINGHHGDVKQKIDITPERFAKVVLNWLDNLHDWCISRQIWWGHRIPVWYRADNRQQTTDNRKIWDFKIYGSDIFNALADGTKKIETRAGRPRGEGDKYWGDIKEGDVIEFRLADAETDQVVSGVEPVKKIVKKVSHFKTIELMLKVYRAEDDYPGKSVKELKAWWNKYPKLAERLKEHGIWAIELGEIGQEEIYVGTEEPKNDVNFVFLHGFYRTDKVIDPLAWLNDELHINNNFFEKLPHADKPNRQEQTDYVFKNAVVNENTIIVAHSLGNILALKMIEEREVKIRKLVMIAPPRNTHREELKDYRGSEPDYAKIKKLVGEIVIFRDVNDHLVPAEESEYLADKLGARLITMTAPAPHFNCKECQEILAELKKSVWVRDEDTLDTWFSSGMWTFSTLGGIEETPDLKTFHPSNWMQMGYEIIFLWMVRMILMSIYALDQIPFKDVYIHGILRDETGKKFSKSSGNNIDPLEVIKQYGCDALRFSLVSGISPGNDSRFYEEKVEGARNLVNKLWNISRYVITNYELRMTNDELNAESLTAADEWILWKMKILIPLVTEDLNNYKFSQAGERLREFTWDDLADWYLEASKFEKGDEKEKILAMVLSDLMKLWHPFIPFVTEAVWKESEHGELLMTAKWPDTKRYIKIKYDNFRKFILATHIVKAVRDARSEHKVEPSKKIKMIIYAGGQEEKEFIESQSHLIVNLRTGISELEIKIKGEKIPGAIYLTVADRIEIYLIIAGFDIKTERDRLAGAIKAQEERIESLTARLANKEFTSKAPEKIVKAEKDKLELYKSELKKLKEQIKSLK